MTARINESNHLRAVFEANRLVHNLSIDMPVSILLTFLGVAIWGHKKDSGGEAPLTLKEIARNVGLPSATISRHLRYLGVGEYREGRQGLGVVDTEIWVLNQRQKIVYLTTKGQTVVDQINYILDSQR